jgi:hypothetical protein
MCWDRRAPVKENDPGARFATEARSQLAAGNLYSFKP